MKNLTQVLILCFVIISLQNNSLSQNNLYLVDSLKKLTSNDSAFSYYPLAIGNTWYYQEGIHKYGNPNILYRTSIRKVVGDTILPNSEKYFVIKEINFDTDSAVIYYERIDSSTSTIFRYINDSTQFNHEVPLEDLNVQLGDTLYSHRFKSYPYNYKTIYSKIDSFSMFGYHSLSRNYVNEGFPFFSYSLTKNIGLTYLYTQDNFNYLYAVIKGWIVNGVLKGDTTITNIQSKKDIPLFYFLLYQNYPNPFNPSTTISWRLAEGGFTSLKVYDVLGREVATLIDEEESPGYHKIEFNSERYKLSSGVYLVHLRVTDKNSMLYTHTIKLSLIK